MVIGYLPCQVGLGKKEVKTCQVGTSKDKKKSRKGGNVLSALSS